MSKTPMALALLTLTKKGRLPSIPAIPTMMTLALRRTKGMMMMTGTGRSATTLIRTRRGTALPHLLRRLRLLRPLGRMILRHPVDLARTSWKKEERTVHQT